jgi:hypothetical protein
VLAEAAEALGLELIEVRRLPPDEPGPAIVMTPLRTQPVRMTPRLRPAVSSPVTRRDR